MPDSSIAYPKQAALELHHIGMACRDLDRETNALAILGYVVVGDDFHDPQQGVVGRFLEGQHPRIELLASDTKENGGVLAPWLHAGTKMYHAGYLVSDFDIAVAGFVNNGGRLVRPPVPAVAFGFRRIAFVMLANMLLIELIEMETA